MMQPPSEHEQLSIRRRNVAGGFFKTVYRLIGILIWQRGLAAEPGVGGQRIGIKTPVDVSDSASDSHVLSLRPRNDALTDDVEQHGAVVIISAMSWVQKELADFDFHTITCC